MIAEPAVSAAVAEAHRHHWATVLSATVRLTRDIDVAEECVQDAYARALTAWASRGIPATPVAWLTTVAKRRALDVMRRDATEHRALPLLLVDPVELASDNVADHEIAGDRLRLIFTCCHPALTVEAQVALALRLLCGLTTAEVARAFLVSEPTPPATQDNYRITRL